jgi:hypothetical protein
MRSGRAPAPEAGQISATRDPVSGFRKAGDRAVESIAVLSLDSGVDRARGFADRAPRIGSGGLRTGLARCQRGIQLRLAYANAPLADAHMAQLATGETLAPVQPARRLPSLSSTGDGTRSLRSRRVTVHGRSAYFDPSLAVKRHQTATSTCSWTGATGRACSSRRAVQHDLEDLLGCRVHVMRTEGLSVARGHVTERIEREAVLL